MATEIRLKRTTNSYSAQTVLPGEVGVIESRMGFGYATAADTENLAPIFLANQNTVNTFSSANGCKIIIP